MYNSYLACEYGIDLRKKMAYEQWIKSHRPFHWFIEFYGILKNGGFDVIIGNPPYVEISDVRSEYSIKGLSLTTTGNLYSLCVERFICLARNSGRSGVIMPISSVSTPRMLPLMRFMIGKFSALYLSNFAVRPGKLFVGVDMNLTIMLGEVKQKDTKHLWSTEYNRWQEGYRPFLFSNLTYVSTKLNDKSSSIGKLGTYLESSLLERISNYPALSVYRHTLTNLDVVYYHSGGRYFRKCLRERLSNEYKELAVANGLGDTVICMLSSSFYYWLWIAYSDCYHVTKKDIDMIPVPPSLPKDTTFEKLSKEFMKDLYENAKARIRNRADGSKQKEVNFQVSLSKPIIDEIDHILAHHYGLTDEELDFIINYDIKYRLGRDNQDED